MGIVVHKTLGNVNSLKNYTSASQWDGKRSPKPLLALGGSIPHTGANLLVRKACRIASNMDYRRIVKRRMGKPL
jgi:hypothetical protein